MEIGAKLIVKTVKAIESGEYKEQPQPQSDTLKHAPKIFKEDCKIDWNRPSNEVYNLIRGLSPYPTAFTFLNGKILKVFKASVLDEKPEIEVGSYLTDGKTYLKFASSDGFLELLEVQYEGKKRMPISDFLRGIRL